jgi:ribosomal protein L24E
MSKRIICDFCEETINGQPKITSTEKDGRKLDFCSTTCFIDFTRDVAAAT